MLSSNVIFSNTALKSILKQKFSRQIRIHFQPSLENLQMSKKKKGNILKILCWIRNNCLHMAIGS